METHFPHMEPSRTRLASDRVLGDLKTLADDADALLRATAQDAGEKAKEIRARLAIAIDKAKSTCDEMRVQGFASAKAAAQKTDDTIRAHPYESMGVAFGVGVLLGALLTRK